MVKKYIALRADDRSINAKAGNDDCTFVETNQTVLIGISAEPTQSGEATKMFIARKLSYMNQFLLPKKNLLNGIGIKMSWN